MSTIGERIRASRKKAGLSAADLGRRAAEVMGRDKPISASAIRNQENGTNGVPYEAISAYAEVLGVSKVWLGYGDGEHLPPASKGRAIALMRNVGLGWLPADLEIPGDKPPIVRVYIPEYNGTELFSSYFDATWPSPDYPAGMLLIYAYLDAVGAREGDHVILYRPDGPHLYHSIRVVGFRQGEVFLDPLPGAPVTEEAIKYDPSVFVAGVIVATYRLVPPRPGPLLIKGNAERLDLSTENLLTLV